MKRHEAPSDGPSSENALLPRDGPQEARPPNKGGRGIKSKDCWEQGASKGSVMAFFSSKNKKGENLEEGTYRCILHEEEAQEVILTKGSNGEWNLKQHVKTAHGWVPDKPDASAQPASAKKGKTQVPKSDTFWRTRLERTR